MSTMFNSTAMNGLIWTIENDPLNGIWLVETNTIVALIQTRVRGMIVTHTQTMQYVVDGGSVLAILVDRSSHANGDGVTRRNGTTGTDRTYLQIADIVIGQIEPGQLEPARLVVDRGEAFLVLRPLDHVAGLDHRVTTAFVHFE